MFFDFAVGVLLLLFAGRNFGEQHVKPIIGTASAAAGIYFLLESLHLAAHECLTAIPGIMM